MGSHPPSISISGTVSPLVDLASKLVESSKFLPISGIAFEHSRGMSSPLSSLLHDATSSQVGQWSDLTRLDFGNLNSSIENIVDSGLVDGSADACLNGLNANS